VAYDTTDVRGVGERLPFKDASFDAVFSLAVLEHVKDPFQCAREIVRVLKPGGELYCCVPFLQPMHGYPHHYYNMTEQGIRNLFEPAVAIRSHEVLPSMSPIHTLSWIARSWAEGLAGQAKDEFLNLTMADLLAAPETFEGRAFLKQLGREKNFELASATVIVGEKR
jgi:SAM-dependent methyltransferase